MKRRPSEYRKRVGGSREIFVWAIYFNRGTSSSSQA